MKKTTIVSILFLVLIFTLQTFLLIRDIPNPTYSYIGDEYAFYDLAKGIASGSVTKYSIFSANGVYGHAPILDSVYQASVMHLFGINLFGWKMSTIIVVLVASLLVFFVAALLFGDIVVGVASSAFFLFSPYLISFAHIPYNNLHALIPFLLAILLFLLFHCNKKFSYIFIFLSGLVSGFSFYTFLTARLVILFILSFLIIGKNRFKKIVSYLVGFTIMFIPFLLKNKDQVFFQMSRRYFSDPDYKGLNLVGLKNFFFGLFFEKYIPVNHYFIGPFLTNIFAGSFLVGCYFLFKNRKRETFRVFFLVFWFLIIQIIITIGNVNFEVPNTRLHIILPALCLVAGFGIVSFIKKPFFILILLTINIFFQIYFFYYITPRKYPTNSLSLLLKFARENQNKKICTITDGPENFYFSYGQVQFLSNMYNQQNIVPFRKYEDLNNQYDCNVFAYLSKVDLRNTHSVLEQRFKTKKWNIYVDESKLSYLYYLSIN